VVLLAHASLCNYGRTQSVLRVKKKLSDNDRFVIRLAFAPMQSEIIKRETAAWPRPGKATHGVDHVALPVIRNLFDPSLWYSRPTD
jgi:hypothetical protein